MTKLRFYFFAITLFLTFFICKSLGYDIYKSFFKSTTITWFLWISFDKFLWKFISLKQIPPNINGTWNGVLKSSYKDIQKEATIHVEQSFSNVVINIETNEINSESISASWVKEGSTFYLIYNYITKPQNIYTKENSTQYGSGRLLFKNGHLILSYWTSAQTIGSGEFIKSEK